MAKLYLNPVTTVNLSKGFVSSKTTTGTRVVSFGSPRQDFVVITVPSRPALKTTVPSALVVTGTFLFSPGANLFPGPKFSPSVKTWAFSFDRFVISATTVLLPVAVAEDAAACVAVPVPPERRSR